MGNYVLLITLALMLVVSTPALATAAQSSYISSHPNSLRRRLLSSNITYPGIIGGRGACLTRLTKQCSCKVALRLRKLAEIVHLIEPYIFFSTGFDLTSSTTNCPISESNTCLSFHRDVATTLENWQPALLNLLCVSSLSRASPLTNCFLHTSQAESVPSARRTRMSRTRMTGVHLTASASAETWAKRATRTLASSTISSSQ